MLHIAKMNSITNIVTPACKLSYACLQLLQLGGHLFVHIVPRLPRKRGGARGTPGRTSDPLAVHIVTRLPRKRRGARVSE